MTTPSLDTEPGPEASDDPNPRLANYVARTQRPLDLLALFTLWIVLVPPGDFGSDHHASTIALVVRVGLSVIFGIDMAIRIALATRHWHYLRTHLLGLVVVVFPPVRVVLSLELIRSLFRRGNLLRFMLAASILVLNGTVIVYLYERHAAGSNIHTLGQSLWWSVTTVTTVGYGDYYPVTAGGKITAACTMAIGILTLAVVTAQVASSFVDDAAQRRAHNTPADTQLGVTSSTELAERLNRIEALLNSRSSTPD